MEVEVKDTLELLHQEKLLRTGGSGGGSRNSGTGTGTPGDPGHGGGNTPTDPNHPQVQGYKGGDSNSTWLNLTTVVVAVVVVKEAPDTPGDTLSWCKE